MGNTDTPSVTTSLINTKLKCTIHTPGNKKNTNESLYIKKQMVNVNGVDLFNLTMADHTLFVQNVIAISLGKT